MKKYGKILFFNANDGRGIMITSKKEKISFNVESWDDFEVMPTLGLKVVFLYEDKAAHSIVSLENENDLEETDSEEDVKTEQEKPAEKETQPEKETESDEDDVNDEDAEERSENDAEGDETTEKESQKEVEEKAFKTDDDIEVVKDIDDLKEELGEREESVTVSLNLSKAVSNYFNSIKIDMDKRSHYREVEGRLDYLLIRRFLWTTFNNLSEIDLHIINPAIRALSNDLKYMATIYDDFMRKIKYPPLAYEEVFLSCQAEYGKIREGAEKTIEKLNVLKGNEKYIGSALRVKKNQLSKEIQSDEFELLKTELKSMNGAYVDVVHMMAELDERYKHDMKLLVEFEKEYRADFYVLFSETAVEYKKNLVEILSAQAFTLDGKLWQAAKNSKAIKAHFHKAGISGEFNTKTYLKYFLGAQDTSKLTGENKKLFDLYEYLVSLHKDYIMLVVNSAEDAMDYEFSIKNIDKSYDIKAFIDEKSALKWAMRNNVKILIIEDRLAKIHVNTFLKYYQKYILAIPKIIILGNSVKSDEYVISKVLAKEIAPRVLAQNV